MLLSCVAQIKFWSLWVKITEKWPQNVNLHLPLNCFKMKYRRKKIQKWVFRWIKAYLFWSVTLCHQLSTVSENMDLLFAIWLATISDDTVSQRAIYLMLREGIKTWTSMKDLQGMCMNQHILLFLTTLAPIVVKKIFICTECIHHSLWFSSPQ